MRRLKCTIDCIVLILFLSNCTSKQSDDVYQKKRENIVSVKDSVKFINTEDVLIGPNSWMSILNNYWLVADYRGVDKLIHIFDKNSFKYLASTGDMGQGPSEITSMGVSVPDASRNELLVNDHAKYLIYAFNIDSAVINSSYQPHVRLRVDGRLFPSRYTYFADTLSIGEFIKPIGTNDFQQHIGRWNMKSSSIDTLKYYHPAIAKRRIFYEASQKHDMIAVGYRFYDLVSIYDLEGNFRFNIYGPMWSEEENWKLRYFGSATFCKDKLVMYYSGDKSSGAEQYPDKLMVFNLDGTYIKTLEVGYRILSSCYDEEKNRIVMNLNEEEPYAYLNLDGLI